MAQALTPFSRARVAPAHVGPRLFRSACRAPIDHQRRQRRPLQARQRLSPGAHDGAHDGAYREDITIPRAELAGSATGLKRLTVRDRDPICLRPGADLPFAKIGTLVDLGEHGATSATRPVLLRLRGIARARR